ncbi:MAG TPA: DUF1552 domain-containing protein [Alphaproteobacteria bacterium]|nr:DUF1552 domain-containing protein [Alphaproteobacteria bacterium]
MSARIKRRSLLRGILAGMAVSVPLPLLDCFLNGNGTALADTGAPLPIRFGTWFWGLGVTPGRWLPTKSGLDFDILPELKPIEQFKQYINVLSGFDVRLDGHVNVAHKTGLMGCRTGAVPVKDGDYPATSIDVLISNAVGTETRFRSLELAATGNPEDTYSFRNATSINPAEGSPVAFYARVFGPGFRDPNAADFKPDPAVMLRKSVLSPIKEERDQLMREVGSQDRARLDEYFSSLRQLEHQLQLQLEKPPPLAACVVPPKPFAAATGYEVETVQTNHKLLARILAMAIACDQTRVFNMVYSNALSSIHKTGGSTSHHAYTHEEPNDPKLGYQPVSAWFTERSMEAWGDFVGALASLREGDGTLLDNCVIYSHTDTNYAKTHSITAIPAMTAGRAGGRLKTGIHIVGNGDPISRVGLTLQQAMGLSVEKWGTLSMETAKPISQILA